MNLSFTGVGAAIVVLLEAILPMLGIEVPEGGVAKAVEGVVTFVGFVLLVYGQWRRPDVSGFVFKK
jgi:uncharacterized membrane protein